ncbi:MAG: hypothetical protein LQ343_002481 [Gyalolechia ehrenbergii]|nr:MAG: hypothetical protein LQ343_002481 [Gyalolechia ehrenbergii]
MVQLLDLPTEILSQIARDAVSYSSAYPYLPRSTFFPSHWHTCKKWYQVVTPIFYGNLVNSGKLYLSYNDLVHFPGKQTRIYQHYCDKLEKISLRLQGQPSDENADTVFFNDVDEGLEDNDGSELDMAETHNAQSDEDTASHASSDESADSTDLVSRDFVPHHWRDDVAGRLRVLSQLITDCPLLDELAFQAYYGFDKRPQSQWNYLDCGAMEHLVLQLPRNLKYLTLDLAGTDVVPSRASTSEHLCPAIAQCILTTENVRLRLRHICPSVFGIKSIHSCNQQGSSQPGIQQSARRGNRNRGRRRRNRQRRQRHIAGTQNYSQQSRESVNQQQLQFVMHEDLRIAGTSRLKSLVVRLSLPHFPADLLLCEHDIPFDAKQCRSFQASRNFGLPRVMALAARHLLDLEPGIESLKISFKDPDPDSLILYATDCVSWKMVSVPEGKFCAEDDGEEWEDWENKADLMEAAIPSPAATAQMALAYNVFRPAGSTMAFDSEDGGSDEDEEGEYAMNVLANSMYPGALAAGLEIGDIVDLMEHDMIFGEDHTPF